MRPKPNLLFHLGIGLYCILACSRWSHAQNNRFIFDKVPQFLTESAYTYVYAIPTDSVLKYVYSYYKDFDSGSAWLTHPVYVIPNNQFDSLISLNTTPTGYYLSVTAFKNEIIFEIKRKAAFRLYIVDLKTSKILTFRDSANRILSDIDIRLGTTNISYDTGVKGFIIRNFRNRSLITMRKGNDISFLRAYKNSNSDYERQIPHPYEQIHSSWMRQFTGYLVTNKPVYQPHDTVKWKAYLENTDHGNKLVKESLRITLSEHYHDYNIAANYAPAEAGVYFGEFILGDTIQMDREYTLDLYGTKSGLHKQVQFRTEDYQLDETYLKVSGEGRSLYQPGDSVNLYAYAYNANKLPIHDGQFRISVLPGNFNHCYNRLFFIPDTLYQSTVNLNPGGETNIGFSTKYFPGALSSFICVVQVTNGNNEHADTSFMLNFSDVKRYIDVREENGHFHAELIGNKKRIPGSGSLITSYPGFNGPEIPIQYPYDYKIGEEDVSVIFRLKNDSGIILDSKNITASKTVLSGIENFIGDTAVLELNNPSGVLFRYSIFIGNKFLISGSVSHDTLFKIYSRKWRTVSIIGTYTSLGEAHDQRFDIFKRDRNMNIRLEKKDLIYPGQSDSIRIHLITDDGIAIPATNVTVLAFNSRFCSDYTPEIPYQGSLLPAFQSKKQKKLRPLPIIIPDKREANRRWLKLCGADTQFFYKNLYLLPETWAIIQYSIPGSVAPQIGVYLQKGHEYIKPQYLLINDDPAQISFVNSTNPEGLFVTERPNFLRIRMDTTEYYIGPFRLPKGSKTDFFLNIDSVRKLYPKKYEGQDLYKDTLRSSSEIFIHWKPLPDSLTYEEQSKLAGAIFMYRNEFSGRLYDHERPYGLPEFYQTNIKIIAEHPYKKDDWYSREQNDPYLIGPINFGESLGFYQRLNTKSRFTPEQGYIFSIRPQMARVEKENLFPYLSHSLKDQDMKYWPDFNYITPNPDLFDTLEVDPDISLSVNDHEDKYKQLYENRYNLKVSDRWIAPDDSPGFFEPTCIEKYKIRNLIFRRLDPANKIFIASFPAGAPVEVPAGSSQVIILYEDNHFQMIDSIYLAPGGITVYPVKPDLPRDTFIAMKSPAWLIPMLLKKDTLVNLLPVRFHSTISYNKPEEISSYFSKQGGCWIKGVIKDDSGPVINVEVQILNAEHEVVGKDLTDFDGEYKINVIPGIYRLKVVHFEQTRMITDIPVDIGQTVTVNARFGKPQSLMSVAVHSGSYARPLLDPENPGGQGVRVLDGVEHAASRNVIDLAALSTQVFQEGTGYEVKLGIRKQVIVDGVQLNTAFSNQPPMSIERPDDDQLVPEHPGRNSYKKTQAFFDDFLNNMLNGSGLRRSFRDWAIWEPNLWTDDEGIARFTAQYPDNQTSWKTYVLAMNHYGYSGRVMQLTRAFKPLSAELNAPRFLRYGDSAELIGKAINYTSQSFFLNTQFLRDSLRVGSDTLTVHNTRIQPITIAAPGINSGDTATLKLSYSITASNGFMDGEERSIPIYPIGATETKGAIIYLDKDTSFEIHPDSSIGHFRGRTHILVDGSPLSLILDEIEHLKEYPHGCNEQLSSKLLAIYYEESIKKMLGEKNFNNTRTKKKIISKLISSQRLDGGFSWWNSDDADLRVTNYIISSLQMMNEVEGLQTILRKGLDYLNDQLTRMTPLNQIATLQTLSAADYPANYKPILDQLDSARGFGAYQRFAMIKIRKEQGLPYRTDLDAIMRLRTETMNGMYWNGNSRYDWYSDELATALLAYTIIKKDSIYDQFTLPVMRYILFHKNGGYYPSTASSGLVLSSLLPEILKDKNELNRKEKNYFKISGSIIDSTAHFPRSYDSRDMNPVLHFKKQGISPMFLSVSFDYFNTNPAPTSNDFTVQTYFLNARHDTVSSLKAGDKVTIRTVVRCKKKADYVMVSVPIPAGCLQVDKTERNFYMEAARENFKDQTDVFCRSLEPEVDYTFDVKLEVRYKGRYVLSPASAGMMYYPEEFGNTAIKKIVVH